MELSWLLMLDQPAPSFFLIVKHMQSRLQNAYNFWFEIRFLEKKIHN